MSYSEQQKAKSLAFYLLGKRSYTVKGLKEKLEKREFAPQIVKEVIAYLSSLGYLDDRKFALNYLESRQRQQRGPYKIVFELQRKGIGEELSEEVFQQYSGEQAEEIALELAKKKKQMGAREKSPAQIYRFLLNRGFASQTAGKVIGKLFKGRNGE